MERKKERKAKVTPADEDAAARLLAIWKRVSKAKGWTQEDIADKWGEKGITQGAVSQYLHGKVPLNLKAVMRFAALFDCKTSDIRSDIEGLRDGADTQAIASDLLGKVVSLSSIWPFNFARERFDRLSNAQRVDIEEKLIVMMEAFEAENARKAKIRRRRKLS